MQLVRNLLLALAWPCLGATFLSAQTEVLVPGFLKFEVYADIPGVTIADLTGAAKFPNAPDHVWYATAFDSRTVYRDDTLTNRGVRISGFVTPSESGNYEFMLRSDDASQLFISIDNNFANLALIAEETTCCGAFEETGMPETSAARPLVAGQRYAIRAIYKQGGGGNFCQVAWRKAGDTTPAASLTPISGSSLSTLIAPTGTVAISQQPAAVTAPAAGSATFKVQFNTSHLPVMVVWQKDGISLPGRLGDTLTLGPLTAADAGSYRAIVSIPGATMTSSPANLTVTPDVTPPRIVKATVSDTLTVVSIEFSETMDSGGLADEFSYALTDSIGNDVTVIDAIPLGPAKVRLITDPLSLGATYHLSLVDIRDLAGNLPADGNTFAFPTPNRVNGGLRFEAYLNLAGTDPNVIRTDPRYPDSPDIAAFVTEFSSRQVFADAQSRDNYGGRIYGWIIPQETAQYEFFIRSDDGSQLYLSPDEYSSHAVAIAGETGCCGPFEEPGAPETSVPQSLTAHQPYYIEALWKEGGGGDYCDVAWRKVGDPGPARNLTYIQGSVLAADAPPATFAPPNVAFTSPAGGSVISTNVPLNLILSATAVAPKSVTKIELLEQGRVVGQINESPYSITFYELRADSHTFVARVTDSAGQVATSAPLTVSIGGEIQRIALTAINDVTTWRYDRSGQDLGTAWSAPAFDDSSWPSGRTLIADESTTTVEPIRTAISRFNDQGVYVKTFYFRTRFNFTGASIPGIKLTLRHVVDDGAVFYLNGSEIHRFGIAPGPVTAATDATGHENVYEGPYDIPVTALVEGENVLAAEVHQAGGSSSDMVFGAELTATVPGIPRARLSVTRNAAGQVVISWAPAIGTLESSTSLGGPWLTVPNATNPHTVTPAPGTLSQFFRVKQ